MIWNEAIETMPRSDLEDLQGERLRRLVGYVYERVPFYRQRLDQAGVSPDDFTGRDALETLPFTVKRDLRDNYPYGLFAVPLDDVARLHASSGTTGKPTLVGYTAKDLEHWAEVCARCLALSGAVPGDVFQNAYGYGLFTGGLGMHYGAELMGLTVIPASGGFTARQILLLRDLGTDIMSCTPSYALTLADALLAEGIDPAELKVRSFVLGAEPWTDGMRAEIEQKLKADAVNIYGLSEIIGPGVSNECVEAKEGAHLCEDHFLTEVVDPESGEPLPDGEVGELVFTTLTKEAIPLLRYRTGDLASLNREPCVCGRTHARMSRIVGRVDDMLIIRGVNVFPSQIEAALMGMMHLSPHHKVIVNREGHLDNLAVECEVTATFFNDVGEARFAIQSENCAETVIQLQADVGRKLRETLGLTVDVSLLPPGRAPRSEGGKLSRIEDRRNPS